MTHVDRQIKEFRYLSTSLRVFDEVNFYEELSWLCVINQRLKYCLHKFSSDYFFLNTPGLKSFAGTSLLSENSCALISFPRTVKRWKKEDIFNLLQEFEDSQLFL